MIGRMKTASDVAQPEGTDDSKLEPATQSASSKGRPARKRDAEVLAAATRVLSRRSYADATVQDIADELGILKGSLYHYIKTKEDLLFWLLEDVHSDVEDIRLQVAQAEGLTPVERISLYVRNQVLYNLANLERISIYYHDLEALSGERLEQILGARHAHERFIAGLIRDAQAQGLAEKSLDPTVITNCVFATIIWTYRWFRPSGRITGAAVAEQCANFAVQGITGNTTAVTR
jgi:TetR/AcrR family transcriptional regulator, cholesterol catabolism regulator